MRNRTAQLLLAFGVLLQMVACEPEGSKFYDQTEDESTLNNYFSPQDKQIGRKMPNVNLDINLTPRGARPANDALKEQDAKTKKPGLLNKAVDKVKDILNAFGNKNQHKAPAHGAKGKTSHKNHAAGRKHTYPIPVFDIKGESYEYFGGKDAEGKFTGVGYLIKNVIGDWRSGYIGGFCEGEKRGFGVEFFLNSDFVYEFFPMLTTETGKTVPTEMEPCILRALEPLNTCTNKRAVLKCALKKFPVAPCVPSKKGPSKELTDGFPVSETSDSQLGKTIDSGTKLDASSFGPCPKGYKAKFQNSKCLVFNCKNSMSLAIKLYSMTADYHPMFAVSDMTSDVTFENMAPIIKDGGEKMYWALSDKKRYVMESGTDTADPLGGVSRGDFSFYFDSFIYSFTHIFKIETFISSGNDEFGKRYRFFAALKPGNFELQDSNGKLLRVIGKYDKDAAPQIDAENQTMTFFFDGAGTHNGAKQRGELILSCGEGTEPIEAGTRTEGNTIVYFLKSYSKVVCSELSKGMHGNDNSVQPLPRDPNGKVCMPCLMARQAAAAGGAGAGNFNAGAGAGFGGAGNGSGNANGSGAGFGGNGNLNPYGTGNANGNAYGAGNGNTNNSGANGGYGGNLAAGGGGNNLNPSAEGSASSRGAMGTGGNAAGNGGGAAGSPSGQATESDNANEDAAKADHVKEGDTIQWPVNLRSPIVFTEKTKPAVVPYFEPTLKNPFIFQLHSPTTLSSVFSFMLFSANAEYNPVMRLYKATISGHNAKNNSNYELVGHHDDSYSLFDIEPNRDYIVEVGLDPNAVPVGKDPEHKFTVLIGERNLDLYASYANSKISSMVGDDEYGFGIKPKGEFTVSKNGPHPMSYGTLDGKRVPYFNRDKKTITLFYSSQTDDKNAELELECSTGGATQNGPENFKINSRNDTKVTATLTSGAPCAIIQKLK